MASKNRSSGTAAFRYASALVELAVDAGVLPQIEKDVADLQAMIKSSPDLQSLIRSPLVKAQAQRDFLTALAEQAQLAVLTKNFLLTLASNRRLKDIDAVLKAVNESVASRRGELCANVESAAELSPAQKKTLQDNLGKTTGRPVALDVKVNKDLIGGMIVTVGSLMIDDSVKSKLERLSLAMKHPSGKAA